MKKPKINLKTRAQNYCEGLDMRQRKIVAAVMFALLSVMFIYGVYINYNRYKQIKQNDFELLPFIPDPAVDGNPLDSLLLNLENPSSHERK